MKPAPISQEHQKAVNWLDIEQQLFYNNCPPYLHPVPVPAVYNGSMYPKRLYPDEPGATKFKRLFFPSSGIAQKKRNLFSLQRGITKKSSHLFPILPLCWSTERTAQVRVSGERPHHSWFPFWRRFLELQGGFPWQLSRSYQLECQCREAMLCTETYVLSHTHIKPLNSLQERFYPNSRISKVWKLP